MTRIALHTVKLDTLLALLGGFEQATPHYDRRAHLARLWAESLPISVIADRLEATPDTVMVLRHRYGLPPRKRWTRREAA